MTYLQRVVKNLAGQVKERLKPHEITEIEAEHVSGLLIQTTICHDDQFAVDTEYLRIALNAIRKEKGTYTALDADE